jgi:hypothetical protein
MTEVNIHQPTEAFRDYLEGEVVHEFRRRRTFRRLRAAAVILVSIGIGATATFASAQVRESSAKDSLLQAARAEATLAKVRLTLVQMQLLEERTQVTAGARQAGDLPSANMAKELEADVARLALNMEEIEATSRPPRDDLNAPLVNGRDFVKERIQLQVMTAQQRLLTAQQKYDEAMRRVRVGAATELEAADYGASVLRRNGDLAVLAEKLNARKEFLEKHTDIAALSVRIERTEVEQAVAVTQRELQNAQARMNLVEQRQKAGVATKLEFLEAQVNVQVQELELQKLMRRLKELKAG